LIAADLRALSQPHRAPVADAAYWVCGQARAWVDGNRLMVEEPPREPGEGPSAQAVRAGAAAAWAATDAGVVLERDSIPRQFS
jgi:hypothetical protein